MKKLPISAYSTNDNNCWMNHSEILQIDELGTGDGFSTYLSKRKIYKELLRVLTLSIILFYEVDGVFSLVTFRTNYLTDRSDILHWDSERPRVEFNEL